MKEDYCISVNEYKRKNLPSRVLMAVSVAAGIVPFFIIMILIAQLMNQTMTKEKIIIYGAAICLCQILKAGFYALSLWKAHDIAYSSLAEIRLNLIGHLKKLSLSFFQKRKVGDLTNIIHHDVERTELYLAHGLPQITVATLIPILISISLFVIDWRLGLALISTVPLVFLYQIGLNRLIAGDFQQYVQKTRQMSENLLEYIATIPVIKAFSKDEKRTGKILDSINAYQAWVKKMTARITFPMSFSTMLMEAGFVVLVIIASLLLNSQKISGQTFVLAIILGGIFSGSLALFPTFHHISIIFQSAIKSINSILGVQPLKINSSHSQVKAGDVELKAVHFSYEPGSKVLQDIDLVFKKNSINAIVGSSGSGKTTIANLLMGFWQPDQGEITIDGQDITAMGEQKLSQLISIVQQETFLFNMSIKDNIKIGKQDASQEEIIEAAQKAQIHQMIMELPQKYDTKVGESGAKLSGGEKQRIAIARMILKNAPIIILDEATSAIDPSNEYLIQKAINNLSRNKTVIMIAHHLNMIMNVDQIIVMEKGKIQACGNHQKLLKVSPLYQQMVEEQAHVDHWQIKEEVTV